MVIAALLGGAGVVRAQADSSARPDTTRRVATPADSTRTDSLGADTVPRWLPVYPISAPPGPLPAGTRYTFTTDSLLFSSLITLSDLLAHIPGVYVARAGFLGQAEPVLYAGRGAQALEVYWDGVPYLPLGRDSVFLDPARIPLAPLERIDVIVLPAAVRVYLTTARFSSTVPHSEVGIATGEMNLANYRLTFARRWRSGVGLSLKADWNNLDGENAATSSTTAFSSTDLWLEASYVPDAHFGASYQILSTDWKRTTRTGLVDGWHANRHLGVLRVFGRRREDGLGPHFELLLASTSLGRDTVVDSVRSERQLAQGSLEVGTAWSRGSAATTVRFQGGERPWQVETRAAWMPVAPVVLALDARHAVYGPAPAVTREGNRLHLGAGLRLPLGFSLRGDLATGKDLQAPTIPTDSLQRTSDVSGALRWENRYVMLDFGGGRRDPFVPTGFASGVRSVASAGPTPRTDYVVVQALLRPVPGLALAAWYADPVGGGGDFEPAHHARYSATFYSKFWRVYRSGVFALRGELAAESWSVGAAPGLGGRDTANAQLPLPGATFVEANIELRIAGVTLFWSMHNLNGMRASYVDGLNYPKRSQFYGARWIFRN